MAKFIVKLDDYYLEWSTIVDAPTTYGMSEDEFREYYRDEYGRNGSLDLEERLERCKKYGTSMIPGHTPEDLIVCNRAGPEESELTLKQIKSVYCYGLTINGWDRDDRGWIKIDE